MEWNEIKIELGWFDDWHSTYRRTSSVAEEDENGKEMVVPKSLTSDDDIRLSLLYDMRLLLLRLSFRETHTFLSLVCFSLSSLKNGEKYQIKLRFILIYFHSSFSLSHFAVGFVVGNWIWMNMRDWIKLNRDRDGAVNVGRKRMRRQREKERGED